MLPLSRLRVAFLPSLVVFASWLGLCSSLKEVRIEVPADVRNGDDAVLQCRFDLEGDSLYSVKWYKGQNEFYRFTPREEPSMKVFPLHGLKIDQRRSNWSQVVLRRVGPSLSGHYSCEVSADAPSFHTALVSADMTVVDLPAKPPVITGVKSRYKTGEVLHGNCSSHGSRPAANLTWHINDLMAKPHQLIPYPPLHENQERQTTRLGLRIAVDSRHFAKGRLKIRCTASIGSLYWQITEKSVEEDKPKPPPTTPPSSPGVQDDFGELNRKWAPAEIYPPEEDTAQVATISASQASNLDFIPGWFLILLSVCRIWR